MNVTFVHFSIPFEVLKPVYLAVTFDLLLQKEDTNVPFYAVVQLFIFHIFNVIARLHAPLAPVILRSMVCWARTVFVVWPLCTATVDFKSICN